MLGDRKYLSKVEVSSKVIILRVLFLWEGHFSLWPINEIQVYDVELFLKKLTVQNNLRIKNLFLNLIICSTLTHAIFQSSVGVSCFFSYFFFFFVIIPLPPNPFKIDQVGLLDGHFFYRTTTLNFSMISNLIVTELKNISQTFLKNYK